MGLEEDWYVYHSTDENNWFLQDGGPYTKEQAKKILEGDEEKREDISHRVARIAYPQGATPDKKIERTGLDLLNRDDE
jgi:hypothetical protein